MTEFGTTRRDVLRSGALGVGALGVGALGVGAMTGAVGVASAEAATTEERFFLELAEIDGPSTTKGFEKQIPVLNYRWGVSNTSTSGTGGGGGAGKAIAGPLVFTMQANKASPVLAMTCCTGKHIATATLHGVRVNGNKLKEFLTLTLSAVLVRSLEQHDGGGARPTETVELIYSSVEYVEDGHSMTFSF
jgi:type VI secretion system secreted protein Hcp